MGRAAAMTRLQGPLASEPPSGCRGALPSLGGAAEDVVSSRTVALATLLALAYLMLRAVPLIVGV